MAVASGRVRLAAPTSPRASVLVAGWREAPHLLACLASLAETSATCSFEVVVSLNEPTAALCASLEREVTGATVVSAPANTGFAGACNRAATGAAAELLVFLNDDTVVEPGWLDALVDAADAHPGAGAVGSRVLAPDGSRREDGTVLWSDGSVTMIDRYHSPRPGPAPGLRQVDYCSAVSLLVRAATFHDVGGFDEGFYPAYYEDVDLCLKIQDRGQQVLYEPASVLRHRHGASAPLPYRLFLIERNRSRLVQRWGPVLGERLPPAPDDPRAIAAGVALAAGRQVTPGPGPLVPDRPPAGPDAAELDALRRQVEVLEGYAAELESTIEGLEAERRKRPVSLLKLAARRLLRDVPGVRPLALRFRRLEASRSRRSLLG